MSEINQASNSIEALAESWASMDRKLGDFNRERAGSISQGDPMYTGHYDGYVADAAELIARLAGLGFEIKPKTRDAGQMPEDEAILRYLARKATAGIWYCDGEKGDGTYSGGASDGTEERGYIEYSVYSNNRSIVYASADLTCVEVEYDEDGTHAWDETGRCNCEYIAAANPSAILALFDRIAELRAIIVDLQFKDRVSKATEDGGIE